MQEDPINKNRNQAILSFAIATYNRENMVLELVNKLLLIDSNEIEVTVTVDASTDNTILRLSEIDDKRLRVFNNEINLGAINNMVKAVFNASGKYVFYINDRDSIDTEKIPRIMQLIKGEEYSYILAKNRTQGERITVYKTGYESLLNHQLCTHPTGMIFNGELLRANFTPEEFYKYSYTFYSPDFMARACMEYGKTMVYEDEICISGSQSFLKKVISGANPVRKEEEFHKHPIQLFDQMKATYDQIFGEFKTQLNQEMRSKLLMRVLLYFYKEIFHFKRIKMDEVLTGHYNLKLEKIGLTQMLKYILKYYKDTLIFLEDKGENKFYCNMWRGKKSYLILYCIASTIKEKIR